MKSIELSELNNCSNDKLRRLAHKDGAIAVTRDGEVIGRMYPANPLPSAGHNAKSARTKIDRVAEKVSALWPDGISAEEAVSEQRREL